MTQDQLRSGSPHSLGTLFIYNAKKLISRPWACVRICKTTLKKQVRSSPEKSLVMTLGQGSGWCLSGSHLAPCCWQCHCGCGQGLLTWAPGAQQPRGGIKLAGLSPGQWSRASVPAHPATCWSGQLLGPPSAAEHICPRHRRPEYGARCSGAARQILLGPLLTPLGPVPRRLGKTPSHPASLGARGVMSGGAPCALRPGPGSPAVVFPEAERVPGC